MSLHSTKQWIIQTTKSISVALVDTAGKVCWRERGSYPDAKFLDLRMTLVKLLDDQTPAVLS